MAYLWAAFGDPLVFWKAHVVGWHVQLLVFVFAFVTGHFVG